MQEYHIKDYCKNEFKLSVVSNVPHESYVPTHIHDCYEIMFVPQSEGWCAVDDIRYDICQGAFFLIPPGKTHEFFIPFGTFYYNVMFNENILSESGLKLLRQFDGKTSGNCHAEQIGLMENILQKIETELKESKVGFECECVALLQLLITSIWRNRWDLLRNTSIYTKNNDMLKILKYVQEHFNERITLKKLGEVINKNPVYTGQLFRRLAWSSFSEYLRNYRITKVCELLKDTNLTITQVAYQTGFYDSAHLTHSFKNVTGKLPLEYRRDTKMNSKE